MVKKATIKQYLFENKNLILLDGKIPRVNWRSTFYSENELFNHNGNIGWRLGNQDLIIDIDPRNRGLESFNKLQKKFEIKLDYTVKTPRKGYHIYLKIPEEYIGFSLKKTLKDFPGIDFLSEGSYCLISDCETKDGIYTWSDDLFKSFIQLQAPEKILKLISFENNITRNNEDLGDFNNIIGGSSSSLPEDKVLNMLSKLDPSMKNDEWVKVGMALHDWDPIKGKDLWEDWSKLGDNYKKGETEKRWKSFNIGHGVTLGTINYMVKEVVYDEISKKVDDIIIKIKNSNEKEIEFDLFPKIKKLSLSKLAIEKIAKVIQNRFKELMETKIPISDIRNEITYNGVVSGEFIEEDQKPSWTNEWVYVNSHTCFANLKTLRLLKTEAFNLKNGKYVPESSNGSKQSASKYVADKGYMQTVDMMAYLPNMNEAIVSIEDFKVLNSFNINTVPKASIKYSEEGLKAIELVKKHISFICGDDKNSNILTQWIAHQIQFPGKQILWSPVIQSIQGVGKSFFGELLRCCLGDRNVGTVSPTQVISDFNGWATGVSVNVLEELRVKGHNRYNAVNSLKPLITDRMIQINDKGVKQFMTYNTTNYICFTNYKDSIPLDSDDRRWWVIFVNIDSLDEMSNIVGESAITYFPNLFNAVRTYGSEIRKWLLEYNLTDEFLSIKQAPITNEKLNMIATEECSLEGYVEIKEMIEKGSKYYNKNVISSSDLFCDFLFENPDIELNNNKKNYILKKLGFTALSKLIKVEGKSRRIWSKKHYSNEEIRQLLK